MSTLDASTLRNLRDQIRTAVEDLAAPARRPVLRDDGTTTIHPAASLLDQLAAETAPGTARPGAGAGRSGAPAAVEVIDLSRRITAESAAWCWYLTGHGPPESLPERVRTIAEAAGALVEPEDLRQIHRFVTDWARSIRDLLDPPRRLHLVEPCPACESRTIHRHDDTGELVRQPALEVDPARGCQCLACGSHWPPEHLEHLAAVLGCEPVGA